MHVQNQSKYTPFRFHFVISDFRGTDVNFTILLELCELSGKYFTFKFKLLNFNVDKSSMSSPQILLLATCT